MTKINLPPRKWYSLEKAIREIKKRTGEELDIEDLLHYWTIDKIDLYTKIYYNPNTNHLILSGKEIKNDILEIFDFDYETIFFIHNSDEDLSKYTPFDFFVKDLFTFFHKEGIVKQINDAFQNIFNHKEKSESENYNSTLQKRNNIDRCINGFISFNTNLLSNFIDTEDIIKQNKINLGKDIKLTSPKKETLLNTEMDNNERIYLQLSLKENIFISLDNVYILHNELIDFINGIENNKPIKMFSPRKQNNQISLIKALLKLHYDIGENEGEKARRLLDSGQLWRDLNKKGIDIKITPETLRNWYNSEF